MIKQIAIITCIIIQPLYSFAATRAECVMLARAFNDDFSARIQIGLNIKVPTQPDLAIAVKDGYEPTLKESARIAPVLRACATTDLGRHLYKLRIGDKQAQASCYQTNLDTMGAVCDKSNKPIDFRKF